MNDYEKTKIVHNYSEFSPFKFNDKIISIMEEIYNRTIILSNLDYSMREISSKDVLNIGKDYLNSKFILHSIPYLSTENRKNIENSSKINPNVLCQLYSKKIDPFKIPVEFVYGDYFAGDLVLGYDFSDELKVLKKMKIYFEKIYLSKVQSIINSSSYVHEIVHTQIERKGAIIDSNNSEALSIFMELVFLNDLDSDSLLAYVGLLSRISYMIASYNLLIKNNDPTDIVSNYSNTKYFVSTAKAIALFDKYINSSTLIRSEIINNIQSIFDGDMIVDNFLNYFDATVEKGLEFIKDMRFM